MSDESESVENDEARNVLDREWNRVLNDDEHDYLNDEALTRKIGEVLNGSQLTYKYILVTNVLAKAVNPRIHYRAMQAQSDLSGAYNARSLGHQVLVEWEKEHGERLGGSNEPSSISPLDSLSSLWKTPTGRRQPIAGFTNCSIRSKRKPVRERWDR